MNPPAAHKPVRIPLRPLLGAMLLGIATSGVAAVASLAPVLGPDADTAWRVARGSYTITNVAALPFPATTGGGLTQGLRAVLLPADGANLVLEGQASPPANRAVSAWVRLTRQASTVRLEAARQPAAAGPGPAAQPAEAFLVLTLRAALDRGIIHCVAGTESGPLHDLKKLAAESDWPAVQKPFEAQYAPRRCIEFQPYWAPDRRARLEHDMMSIPSAVDRWYEVRVELGEDAVRFWVDDRLVAEQRAPARRPAGALRLTLSPGTELAGLTVAPLAATPGFLPIRLGGYLNGRGLGGRKGVDAASLPAPETVVTVGGVPFVFPAARYGSDHLDISRSLYREGNDRDYDQSAGSTWAGAYARDPARIQLRVPNGAYDSLYVVAACDGRPDHLPLVTAAFYRPGAGFVEDFAARVPLATARTAPADPAPLSVRLEGGRRANLWLVRIPLDPGRLSSFGDMDFLEVEFTKRLKVFQSHPSPLYCGVRPAGLPSGVHIYAATLGRAPVEFSWEPDEFGHVWQAPATPSYTAELVNRTGAEQAGTLTIAARSYDGSDEWRQEIPVRLPAGGAPVRVKAAVAAKLYGYYGLTATLSAAGREWTEKRSFVRLAPDARVRGPSEDKLQFFYWSYSGGHHTPNAAHVSRLMGMAGAYVPRAGAAAWDVQTPRWMNDEPLDPVKVAAYQSNTIAQLKKRREPIPPEARPDHVYFYPEPGISDRLTGGNNPEYWGEAPYELTATEKKHIAAAMNSARLAAAAIRREWPDLKLLIPWGDPGFTWPLLRAGLPREIVDGAGLDIPGFEHLPERQLHEQSIHRLYWIRKEFERAGVTNPILQYCEGIFVPTEPGTCTWRDQMDLYHRWSLISAAYGVKRFYSGWFAFDCGDYYGAEFYGGCGIQRRIPYCDPKPAYAAYATMTDCLNEAEFEGWLPTGSLTTYALRFRHYTRGPVYAFWTVRGARPVTLELEADTVARVTDSMNNTREIPSQNRQVTFRTDPSVVYVRLAAPDTAIRRVRVGAPDHGDAVPAPSAVPVADLGDGTWRFTGERDGILESNSFAVMHYPGRFSAAPAADPVHGTVLVSRLGPQDAVRELMPWYSVLRPARPIRLPGAPARLGLWVRGASDWGRVIYVLRDAKGERWTSIGPPNSYNTDDPGAWSQFCFDGWRYLTFELPGHTGWDSYRKNGTTWWRGGDPAPGARAGAIGPSIVDLPVRIEAIIVEQRTHALYVNDVQPCATNVVAFGKLYAEYESPADATAEAVRQSRLRMPPPGPAPDLPNPIARARAEGSGPAPRIANLEPPTDRPDGRRLRVQVDGAPSNAAIQVWVSPHADGRAAVNLAPAGFRSGDVVRGTWPGRNLHFWVTYTDPQGRVSPPSPARAVTTVDTFTGSALDTGHLPCGCPADPYEHY